MAERCTLSDLPTEQCACRIHGPREDDPTPGPPETVAKHDGECIECYDEIRAGIDVLVFSVLSGWIHKGCR